MRYGIIGDIHANLDALDAVLDRLDAESLDRILCIGDIVGYGAQPTECLARLRDRNVLSVAGNHDLAAAGALDITYFNDTARTAILWTRERLSPADLESLTELPLTRTIDDFILVHSSLDHPEQFEYVMSWEEAEGCLGAMPEGGPTLCFFGHSHVPITFLAAHNLLVTIDPDVRLEPFDKALVNVGSVGQPRDQNPDASCVVYDSDEKRIVRHRVPYDVEAAARKIIDAGLPTLLGERLKVGQ